MPCKIEWHFMKSKVLHRKENAFLDGASGSGLIVQSIAPPRGWLMISADELSGEEI
jgi:hypothetical protein